MRRWICILMTPALVVLAVWLLPFCREQRQLYFREFTYSAAELKELARHPDILFAHAVQAETVMDKTRAKNLYAGITAANPLDMDAWLRLADLAAATGDLDRARDITSFCDIYIGPVLRWKWPHTLLAQGLGMADIFSRNINYLVARQNKVNDALNLLDTHCQGNPESALILLLPENRPTYLQWAIRWKNTPAAQAAWNTVVKDGQTDGEQLADYVNFLISQKQVNDAATVWRQSTGIAGMTNGEFEKQISGKGFDWHTRNDSSGHWHVRQEPETGRQGGTALQIRFNGRANTAFHHVHQVVAVTPNTAYRLMFWWRDKALTTDQVPFVEVVGYDAGGLSVRSQYLQGAAQWRQAFIDFTPPAECTAVVVRVRRLQSHRFDNKIRGSIWLDDFDLKPII